MRNAGAARRRREPEPEPPDPVAAAVAELGRVVAASDATRRRLEGHDQAVTGIIARMEQILAAERPDLGLLAASADELSKRYSLLVVELISDAAHNAEGREILERLEPHLGAIAMMRDAWIAEGRRREAADRDAQAPAPRARHARKRHLNPVPGLGSAAGRAAMAAGVTVATLGGGIAAMHEEATVRTVASAPSAAAGVRQMPPDTAVLLPSPSPRAYQPKHAKKPTADAASASPAPPSSPPVFTPAPQPPAPSPAPSHVTFDGAINVQTDHLVVGPLQGAQLTFSAVGGPLSWTVSAPDGLVLSASSGILGDGQAMVIEVSVAVGTPAGSGVITITDGDGRSVSVPVTWAAVPAI